MRQWAYIVVSKPSIYKILIRTVRAAVVLDQYDNQQHNHDSIRNHVITRAAVVIYSVQTYSMQNESRATC